MNESPVIFANRRRVYCDCGKDKMCIYCHGSGEKIVEELSIPAHVKFTESKVGDSK
jgi:hypothetical protein